MGHWEGWEGNIHDIIQGNILAFT